jgi:hypothetical protein
VFSEGSLVIERYRYESPRGRPGIQWVVHMVKGGELAQLTVKDTRREAAEYVAALSSPPSIRALVEGRDE